jgi:hypothetical protein
MKKILTAISLILALSCVASKAQDMRQFSSRVDDNFKNKHPDWRPHTKQTVGTNTGYTWLVGKRIVDCFFGYLESEETAKIEYENRMRGYPVGPKAKLKDLGDEAVLYKVDSSEESTIIFRKSNVVVIIRAPSFAVAEGLAKEIAGLIPNK